MESNLKETTCRNCGAPVWWDGHQFYVIGEGGELIESDYCRCGEWLDWEWLDGAGGPLAIWPGEIGA